MSRMLVFLAAAFAMATAAPRAVAQLFVEDTARPLLDEAAFESFLGQLDDPASTVVTELFDQYRGQVAADWDAYVKARDGLHRAGEQTTEPSAMDLKMHELDRAQRLRAEELLDTFVENVRSALRGDAVVLDEWERTVETSWRARLLRNLSPGAERYGVVDLFQYFDETLKLEDAPGSVALVRQEYYESLDEALRIYDEGYLQKQDEAFEIRVRLAAGDERGIEDRRELAEWYQNLRDRIIRLNRTYITRVAAKLDVRSRVAWEARAASIFDQPLYVESPVDRILAIIREKGVLTDDRRAQAELIHASYSEARQRLRREIGDAVRDWRGSEEARAAEAELIRLQQQASEGDHGIEPMTAFSANPVIPAIRELRELEVRYTARLRHLFTNEELKQTPAALRWLLHWDQDS